MFEKASRMKLRFDVYCGVISTEDLWDLDLSQLNAAAKGLNKEIKEVEEEDFLHETKPEDKILKLKFDLVLHVLNTKKAESKRHLEATERKVKKDKLLSILEKKQDAASEGKSVEELMDEISALD